MQIQDIVPIIGAGFTKGIRTKMGVVPSVEELQSEMITIMHDINGSNEDEFKEMKFADFSDLFWEDLDKTNKDRCKIRMQEYIESNFTKVYDVDQPKRHLLNCNWQTIFTLNYDDTIESVLDIDVAIPYDKYNIRNGKSNLIKLHGDAKRYAVTGDKKYCVLGSQQYVSLIKEKNNDDIVKVLENTFYSKSILFVGCSLRDELDILYSAGTQLEQKAKLNKEHHIVYVYYNDEGKEVNPMQYKKYGISDIIKVNKESIIDLYELIYSINKKLRILHKKDLLQDYTNIEFEHLDGRNKENIDFLFYDDKVRINDGIIKLPAFFVERNCITKVQNELLSGKGVLNIIYGTKFSGKTYGLLQLLKNILNKKIYYFPSCIKLSDDVINILLERKNVIFLIDDGTMSFEQYRDIIVPNLELLEENKIKIVLAVSKGDVDFYKYNKKIKDTNNELIKLYELDNRFDKIEQKLFNKKIGNSSLVPYTDGDTILDYVFKADDNMLRKQHTSILPKVNFLSNDCEEEVRSLIILTTKGAVTSEMAIDLGIDNALYEFSNKFSITVQKDYLTDLEKKDDYYSGFKFVLNSSYWAVRCLSNFAINSHNHKTVVESYCNIINAYDYLEPFVMNNRIKAYYMLDKIQYLFSDHEKKGTIRLPYMVYEGLHKSLNWNYQFLHQETKCELRMARREKASEEKKEILELAYRNICRAIKLAEESKSANIEYTIAHMDVTKALILINYVFMGEKERMLDTIDTCYQAFVIGESLCPQLEKEEMRDVKKFLEYIVKNKVEEDDYIQEKINELYTRYIRRPSWRADYV